MTGNSVTVSTLYSEGSAASGALLSLVFLTEDGDVDFNRSALLIGDRNSSILEACDLLPGHYLVNAYDIECYGSLGNGVLYPAVSEELFITGSSHGQNLHKIVYFLIIPSVCA